MKKITKREYTERKAKLTAALTAAQNAVLGCDDYENINPLYDAEDKAQDKLDSLERMWDTRNWTGADWASWDLICKNID